MKKVLVVFCGVLVLALIVAILFFNSMYPLKHKELIIKYAQKYGFEPALIASVINVESNFNEKIVSDAGAIGLMQLMPETAQEIATKLKISHFEIEMLYDPEINIEFGCFYLRYLSGLFNDNLTNTLASYNAGLGNVIKWMEDEEYCPDGINLIKTPYNETTNYLKLVNKNQKIYNKQFA